LSEDFPVPKNLNNYQKTKRIQDLSHGLGDYEKEKF